MVAGKRLNGRGKNSGEEKSRKKVGAPVILLLTDQNTTKIFFVPNQSPALFVLLS